MRKEQVVRKILDGTTDANIRFDELRSLLVGLGFVERVKGSHHIFTHPSKPGHISVPHPKQDLGVGLVNKLLKQAGLK